MSRLCSVVGTTERPLQRSLTAEEMNMHLYVTQFNEVTSEASGMQQQMQVGLISIE